MEEKIKQWYAEVESSLQKKERADLIESLHAGNLEFSYMQDGQSKSITVGQASDMAIEVEGQPFLDGEQFANLMTGKGDFVDFYDGKLAQFSELQVERAAEMGQAQPDVEQPTAPTPDQDAPGQPKAEQVATQTKTQTRQYDSAYHKADNFRNEFKSELARAGVGDDYMQQIADNGGLTFTREDGSQFFLKEEQIMNAAHLTGARGFAEAVRGDASRIETLEEYSKLSYTAPDGQTFDYDIESVEATKTVERTTVEPLQPLETLAPQQVTSMGRTVKAVAPIATLTASVQSLNSADLANLEQIKTNMDAVLDEARATNLSSQGPTIDELEAAAKGNTAPTIDELEAAAKGNTAPTLDELAAAADPTGQNTSASVEPLKTEPPETTVPQVEAVERTQDGAVQPLPQKPIEPLKTKPPELTLPEVKMTEKPQEEQKKENKTLDKVKDEIEKQTDKMKDRGVREAKKKANEWLKEKTGLGGLLGAVEGSHLENGSQDIRLDTIGGERPQGQSAGRTA